MEKRGKAKPARLRRQCGVSLRPYSRHVALALATPTAITVGVGKGAREGVLFKNATALEASASIDTVIFDKTGTLTAGKPASTDVIPAGAMNENELCASRRPPINLPSIR